MERVAEEEENGEQEKELHRHVPLDASSRTSSVLELLDMSKRGRISEPLPSQHTPITGSLPLLVCCPKCRKSVVCSPNVSTVLVEVARSIDPTRHDELDRENSPLLSMLSEEAKRSDLLSRDRWESVTDFLAAACDDGPLSSVDIFSYPRPPSPPPRGSKEDTSIDSEDLSMLERRVVSVSIDVVVLLVFFFVVFFLAFGLIAFDTAVKGEIVAGVALIVTGCAISVFVCRLLIRTHC